MALSVYSGIRAKVREIIRDEDGLEWTDDVLDELINDAQREYSFYSGRMRGECVIEVNSEGRYYLPIDFIDPLKVIGIDGMEIPIVSWRLLAKMYGDFRRITGTKAEGVCFDFCDYGECLVYPRMETGTEIGTLVYRRYSTDGKLETRNVDAITEHVLFQIGYMTGSTTSSVHFDKFMGHVDEEVRSEKTLKNRQVMRRGVYY